MSSSNVSKMGILKLIKLPVKNIILPVIGTARAAHKIIIKK